MYSFNKLCPYCDHTQAAVICRSGDKAKLRLRLVQFQLIQLEKSVK
jgi:hypothetical protein